MQDTEMIETTCAICGSRDDYSILYERNFNPEDLNCDVFSARRLPDRIHYRIVRCNRDGLVRSNPVYKSSVVEALYKGSKFTYADHIENLTHSYLKALEHLLPRFSKGARILEVGCGNGFVLTALRDRGYHSLQGVEPSVEAVDNAGSKIKGAIQADFLREGLYPDGSFDLIFFFQTLDHIHDPAGFLSICYRLLVPGGFILAFNHDVESVSSRILKERSPIIDIEHAYLYSQKTIRKLFSKFGFDIIKVYSPGNLISMRYAFWLMPFFSKQFKMRILNSKRRVLNAFLKLRVNLKLGNLCIIAQKPYKNRT